MAKKGTAKVVRRYKGKVYSGSEKEDAESEDEERVPTKPRRMGKSIDAAASSKPKKAAQPSGAAKAKKGKAAGTAKAGQIRTHEDGDVDFDMSSGDGRQDDDMVEMQFDQAA